MSYRNLTDMHRRQAERLGPRPAVGFRRHGLYHYLSWQEYRDLALACAAALMDAGLQAGDRVGILSENRWEWLIADMGLLAAAAVNVPPHAPLTARQIHFQLEDAEVRWLFVSTLEQLAKILQVRGDLPTLEGIVSFERPAAAHAGVIYWDTFLARGRRALPAMSAELRRREESLGWEDLATIMYTSGTTGNPKGVMLTHGNLVSNALAALEVAENSPDSVLLNWLPFSHIYARSVDHYQSIAGGFLLCLATSGETLVQDLADTQPTHISCVPRFYEKVLTAVATADPEKTRRRLRDILGPRMLWPSAGGAPLPLSVAEAYLAAGIELFQGYGLTETSPVITFNRKGHNKIGTVGKALPGVEVAIAADGEVLTRGPHVMKGYWKNPQATAETIQDGWLYTGDLGMLDADGYLRITGRKKEILVLSNGKKVVPNYLEGLILGDECIDQVVVCGEGRNFLTALVVPHWTNMKRALSEKGVHLDHQTDEELARNQEVQTFLRQRLDAALKEVSGSEQIKKFAVLPRPFSVNAEELTVSLKLRRNVIQSKYAAALDSLYRDTRDDAGACDV